MKVNVRAGLWAWVVALAMPLGAVAQLLEPGETALVSAITNVRVYTNAAAVTEVAQATVGTGQHELVFRGLTRHMTASSVQVKGTGAGIIQAVSPRLNYLSRTPKPPRMLLLEDSLVVLSDVERDLRDRDQILAQEAELLLSNRSKLAGEQNGLSPTTLEQMANLMRTRLGEIRGLQAGLQKKLERVRRDRGRLQQELNQIRRERDQPTYEVVVTYQTQAGGKLSLELTYLAAQAGWEAEYDIRVTNNKSPLKLGLKAQVTNNTGVDWKRVRLTLSTANPRQGGTPPTLNPLYVDIYRPQPVSRSRGPAAPTAAKAEAREEAESDEFGDFGGNDMLSGVDLAEPEAASAADYSEQRITTLAIEYDIALLYDVLADGKPRQVDIQNVELPVTFQHYAAPRADRDAFLTANISGWENYSLVPGRANVYFDGTYLTATTLDPTTTQDTLRLGLGRDPGVLVKRTAVRDYTSRKVIGTSTRETRGYEIEVRNAKTVPVELVLEDLYPVSRNSAIEVKLLEAEGAEVLPTYGKLRWKLTLAPGASQKLRFSYEVKYPKDTPLVGLD